MTSEVVVMNSLAVALASDSAATVTAGQDNKVYNSANKLFMLSKRHPVGVMVYSNASLLGIPWETILKMFRGELGSTEYATLEEYGNRLIAYLDRNSHLFPEAAQHRYYLRLLEALYNGIFRGIVERVRQLFFEAGQQPARADIAKEIILQAASQWRAKPDVTCFEPSIGEEMASRFSGEIYELIAKVFDGIGLDNEATSALRELAVCVVAKDEILTEAFSGVVIAGFGRNEYFPVMQSFELGHVYVGRLKYRRADLEKISGDNPSVVRPFAQAEMVETFMRGINPVFEYQMIKEVVDLVIGLSDAAVDAITDLTHEQKEHWKNTIRPHSGEAVKLLVKNLEQHRVKRHLGPIHQAITNLPKDELAHVAASLVNLNSFQKRMSLSPETVGGPIDVAVISKGDGFIWIDRKHYFRPELNHHFFRNYGVESLDGGEQYGEVPRRPAETRGSTRTGKVPRRGGHRKDS